MPCPKSILGFCGTCVAAQEEARIYYQACGVPVVDANDYDTVARDFLGTNGTQEARSAYIVEAIDGVASNPAAVVVLNIRSFEEESALEAAYPGLAKFYSLRTIGHVEDMFNDLFLPEHTPITFVNREGFREMLKHL